MAKTEPKWNLTPDIYSLHTECADQPRLYHYFADKLADARQQLAVQEQTLKVLIADKQLEIRKTNPKKYQLDKYTEETIKALITVDTTIAEQERRVIDTKHEVDVLVGTVEALRQRKSMLEQEVALRLADYYSDVNLPQADSHEMELEDTDQVFKSKRTKIARTQSED